LSTDDPDVGQTHTYAINGGTGASRFEIVNGNEIRVKSGALLDFEGTNSYTLVITATDDGILPLTFSKELTIGLTDANDLPVAVTDNGAANLSFRMSEDDGTKAFDVRANDSLDPDAGALNNVTIDSGSISVQSNMLGIDAGDLNVSVDASNNVEVELVGADWQKLAQGQTLDVTIPYTLYGDQPGDLSTASVTVRVTGQNDAPTNLVISSNEVVENVPGITVGVLGVTDVDLGDTVTYTIRPGFDATLFSIVGNELRVGNAGLDYEASPTRTVIVRATDSGGALVDLTLSINVLDRTEVTLTIEPDIIPASADNTQFIGNAATLNSTDNLDGGLGTDSLVLYGAGTFDLNALDGYAGIEEVQLVNFTGSYANLYLRNETTSAVTTIGSGRSQIFLQDSAAATSIQGGDGYNAIYLSGTSSAGGIDTGNGGSDVRLFDTSSAGSIDTGNGGSYVELNGSSSAGSIQMGNGFDQVRLFGSSSASSIDTGDGGSEIRLQSSNSIGSIVTGSGGDSINFFAAGTTSSIATGAGNDQIYFSGAQTWNPSITIDSGSDFDTLYLYLSNTTLDLRPVLTDAEYLYLGGSNLTALVDANILADLTQIHGNPGSKIVTDEAAVNLTGKSASGVTFESTNATGTTFTIDSSSMAFLIYGGTGSDTIQTTSFAFTAAERDAIFNASSIELIIDSSGFYGDETSNTIAGSAAADNMQGNGGDDRLTGAGGTDSLAGGADADTFVFNFASEGMDTIADFVSGTDKLEISAAGFGGGLSTGTDPATVFGSSSDGSFTSEMERFHLDTSTDTLYFDADGSGETATAVAIAQFPNQAVLQASDWLFV
jgi:VCBS repeat-containing protein